MATMRALLVNAKPDLVSALAKHDEIEVAGLWGRKHDYGSQLDRCAGDLLWYDGGPKFGPRAAWQVRKIISRWRPDIVHAFYGRALAHVNLATLGMSARRPVIVSYRGITSRLSRFDGGDWLSYRHPHVDAHAC